MHQGALSERTSWRSLNHKWRQDHQENLATMAHAAAETTSGKGAQQV